MPTRYLTRDICLPVLPRVSHPSGKDLESKRESLTHLYNEKALRYGIVFDELIRQVAVHSMALATLVGKAFTGHHALLTRLIKVHDAREGQLQKLQVGTNERCCMLLISGKITEGYFNIGFDYHVAKYIIEITPTEHYEIHEW
ncbi:unnamed protein product [Ectocarpus sp. CCAP 1310/34]|nr:unnamed protein product [Ectocarpus sp. CCAP 1310/34]